jgi:XRE family transcriptional regulator, fatty acid utilization regulator
MSPEVPLLDARSCQTASLTDSNLNLPTLRRPASHAAYAVHVPKTFVGPRVRKLRNERGFSQAALAQMLEISPSYLNQIEHDVRPLTVAVLLRITEVFGVDATFFASQDDTRLVAELQEVAMDRDLDIAAGLPEIADIVAAHPTLARAMVNLHRRYRITTAQLAAATEDRFSEGSDSGSITMPHEEVRDYFYQRQNYLHELDTAAEDLTIRMRMHRGDLAGEVSDRLTAVHGLHIVRRIDVGDTVLHHYDPAAKTLEMSSHLSPGQTVFKMAAELAYLEFGDLIDTMVDEGKFTSDESRKLARLGLANYFAAAAVLPYRQFHDVTESFRYDIERLSAFYSVSYETICHRLSTLQRPSMRGVPFSFVRVDKAGNMSKRQSATGFHFSSSGGTCPLWNVYDTFANPGKILVQLAQMPDGRNYMWVARTVKRRASRYGQPGKTFAIGLGCELRHANRLVYSEGLDLSGDNATPIGAGCRVCERDNCPQRAFPALGRALDLDEHRSTVSPYLVKQP